MQFFYIIEKFEEKFFSMNLEYENDHEANIRKKAYRWKVGFALNDTKGKRNKFELAEHFEN